MYWAGGGLEGENNEKDIVIERAFMALGRNLVLGKIPGTHKHDDSQES